MLISTTNLAILPAINKQHDKEVLRNAYIKEDYLYGTDGHSLYKSKLPDPDFEDQYPVIDAGDNNIISNLIPAQLLEKAEKDLPKKSTYPIVAEHVCATETEKHICVSTTDLDTTTTYKARKVQGNYPNVGTTIEPVFANPVETTLSLETLKTLVKVAEKAKKAESKRKNKKIYDGNFWVALTIEGNESNNKKPITVRLPDTTDEVSGLIMPIIKTYRHEGE